jgi:hypothetical protein
VVEHGDVPRRLVGDENLVPVLVELVQDPARGDHVVVRVRREEQDAAAARQLAAAADLRDQRVEHFAVQRGRRAVAREECAQVVLPVVRVAQAEHRLPRHLAQPDQGPDLEVARPRHLAEQPRRGDPGEVGGGRRVEVERRGRMVLEVRGRDGRARRALDRAPHDRRLVLSRRHQRDLARLEDRGDPHRDRLERDVRLAEEVGRRPAPCDPVERHQTGARLDARSRLVEPDVARLPDPEQLEIDPARVSDRLLVVPAVALRLVARQVAPRHVDVRRVKVHVIYEVIQHKPMIALEITRLHRDVLVEVEGDDAGEVEPLLPVQAGQLPVHADRGGAGGEPEHGARARRAPLPDHLRDPARHEARELVGLLGDDDGYALDGIHDGLVSGVSVGRLSDRMRTAA